MGVHIQMCLFLYLTQLLLLQLNIDVCSPEFTTVETAWTASFLVRKLCKEIRFQALFSKFLSRKLWREIGFQKLIWKRKKKLIKEDSTERTRILLINVSSLNAYVVCTELFNARFKLNLCSVGNSHVELLKFDAPCDMATFYVEFPFTTEVAWCWHGKQFNDSGNPNVDFRCDQCKWEKIARDHSYSTKDML